MSYNPDGSFYTYGEDHIHIGDNAHGKNLSRVEVFEFRTGSPYLQWVGYIPSVGIDTYARVISHEAKHKEVWETYHEIIEDAEADSTPDIELNPDGSSKLGADGLPIAVDPNADPDNDGLPTWYERQIGLHPTNPDTTTFAAHSGPPIYVTAYAALKGDGEVVARMAERYVTGPREQDWASDGLNHDNNPGTNDAKRTTVCYPTLAWGSWNAGCP